MTTYAATPTLAQRTLTATGSTLRSIFFFLMHNSRGARSAREAERLSAMSDEDLARLGIRRDEILYRAFGPLIYL